MKVCESLTLGGTSLKEGYSYLNSGNRQRCLECEGEVLRFSNAKWAAHVDDLYIRMNSTNLLELEKVLRFHKYACRDWSKLQDTWRSRASVSSSTSISPEAT